MQPLTLNLGQNLESEFWNDPTVMSITVAVDSWVWVILLINLCSDALSRRSSPMEKVQRHTVIVHSCFTLFTVLGSMAVAVVARCAPGRYYPWRRHCMLVNRLVRIWFLIYMVSFWKHAPGMISRSTSRQVASGRSPFAMLIYMLLRVTGASFPSCLYFPLPTRLAFPIDCIQQIIRLVLYSYPVMLAIGAPSFKGITTDICLTMNVVVAATASGLQPLLSFMDKSCVTDGPLLIVLFVWWVGVVLFPTITAWMVERRLKIAFLVRLGRWEREQEPHTGTVTTVCVGFVVLFVSWVMLHLMVASSLRSSLYQIVTSYYAVLETEP